MIKILTSLVLAGTLVSPGCEVDEPKPIEEIGGIVVKESFYKGSQHFWYGVVHDEYHMVVEGSDGRYRLYIFKGDNLAKRSDTMYDVGSEVRLPIKGHNVQLIR